MQQAMKEITTYWDALADWAVREKITNSYPPNNFSMMSCSIRSGKSSLIVERRSSLNIK